MHYAVDVCTMCYGDAESQFFSKICLVHLGKPKRYLSTLFFHFLFDLLEAPISDCSQ